MGVSISIHFLTLSYCSRASFGLLSASPTHFPAARFEISRCSHLHSRFVWEIVTRPESGRSLLA